jgi:inosine-uridine nucleoside N-ribohydrolase
MQEQSKPPVGIVFDADIGNRIDSTLALALLCGFASKSEVRIVSVSVSNANLQAAAFCEAVGNFYAGSLTNEFEGFGKALPVGLATDSAMANESSQLRLPLGRVNAKGEPLYKHSIKKLNDTAEPRAVIRNALTAQHDQNCIVVLAGPATNLVSVLGLAGAADLIVRKVRFLSLAGGAYPHGAPETNIRADIPAAQKLFAEWPTPIVACGYEVGDKVPFPASSIERDFSWSPHHPVVDAYRAYQAMPYDAPTWAMTAVLHALRPDAGYFGLSERGTIVVLNDGSTRFSASSGGRHRFLLLEPSQISNIVRAYTSIASARPRGRQE